MTGKLKPCPFCGSGDTEMNSYLDDSWFFVQCNNCAVNGPEDYTAESARIAWNQRANNYGKNSD
ncbi:Lar family restriction alleviation protein [Xenorhabdus griffiniae]|uniref:Lar family restriction alleviation protein n=1 Tax=Xenorhabdus griffiniae TaxID=351672 RepID=UPI00167941A6|nr:restriction alleviation protein, Lar family [Xenorhabdus griffiniae]MBE8589108.1 restriction alleviation protein, Lar family [Xenorhabdus griffiniae]